MPFQKGHSYGFKGNPENINKTGQNKGSKWRKNLLKDLLQTKIDANKDLEFKALQNRFPELFDGNESANLQLFIEVKQIQLCFDEDPKVAQAAIREVKDRIEGKPIQKVETKEIEQVKPKKLRPFNNDKNGK